MKKIACLLLLGCSLRADTVTILDTLYNATGGKAQGSISISWPSFTGSDGHVVPAGSVTASVRNGVLSQDLEANIGATPSGTYYTANYSLIGGAKNYKEYWVVPAGSPFITLASVRTITAPSLAVSGNLVNPQIGTYSALVAGTGAGMYVPGSTLTAGKVYYQGSSALALARANSSGTVPGICIAITASFCAYEGTYRFSSTQSWTAGNLIYVSAATAGSLVTSAPATSGQYVQRVGVALAADTILIMPDLTATVVP